MVRVCATTEGRPLVKSHLSRSAQVVSNHYRPFLTSNDNDDTDANMAMVGFTLCMLESCPVSG